MPMPYFINKECIKIISFNVIMINYEYYVYFFQIQHRRCKISVSFSRFWNKK